MHHPTGTRFGPLLAIWAVLALTLLAGCGRDAAPVAGNALPDMEADLARTLQEQRSFFLFKTAADLPANLHWEDGSDLPEFADPNARKGGTFTYYLQDFPRTLRTIGPDAAASFRQYLNDFTAVRVVQPHPDHPERMMPGIARSWAVDAAARTAYFRIDPDARWSDGHPITTDDVVFTFYFLRSPHLMEPWFNNYYTINYESITVYDRLTFAVTGLQAKPDLLNALCQFTPFPRHTYKDFGPGWIERYQWRFVPTTAAYLLADRDIDKGRSLTFRRNPDWWARDKRFYRGRFNPDVFRLEVIRDTDKAAEAFARNDLDLFPLATPKLWNETLSESHPAVRNGTIVKATFYNRFPRTDWGLYINSHKPLLEQLEVRLGIQHATHFDLVCQQFFRGDAVRLETKSDGFPFRTHPTLTYRRFDPDKARAHFARAGFGSQGDDGILRNAKGERLSFTVTTPRPEFTDVLTILKQEAVKAGLELRIEVLDQTTGWKKMQEKNHEIGLVGLMQATEPYPRYWESYHGSNAFEDAYLDAAGNPVTTSSAGHPNPNPRKVRVQSNNLTMTFIPELDRLIEAYDRASTMEEIKRLAALIEEFIFNDATWVNGWSLPYYRVGYARYVKWPAGFNPAQSRLAHEWFTFWIDEDERKATIEARRSGRTFPPQVLTFGQHRQ
ncbi:MAG: extracellular solute-binding protein [Opitutaceae bacterium]